MRSRGKIYVKLKKLKNPCPFLQGLSSTVIVRARDNCFVDGGTNGEFERIKISIIHFEIPGEVGVMVRPETGEVGSVGLSGQIARVEIISPC